jgi:hypothetical protein
MDKPRLLDQVRSAARLRHLSYRTEEASSSDSLSSTRSSATASVVDGAVSSAYLMRVEDV